jgi:hypothetical protein
VAGAADDCFTCAKRGIQCDRRRPYCSQCIDIGQECAGYKTALTWGVGVASRGKLRGLSLPVKGSRPAVNPPKPQLRADSTQLPQFAGARVSSAGVEPSLLAFPAEPSASMSQHQIPAFDASINTPSIPAMHVASLCTNMSVPHSHGPGRMGIQNTDQTLAQQTLASNAYSPPAGADALTHRPPEVNALASFTQNCLGVSQPSTAGNQLPSKSQRQGSEETPAEHVERQMDPDPRNSPLWAAGNSPSFSQLLLARSVGRTPRLRYLISYYVEVIAPVIVAFDGPTNPFRTQILRLAQDSEPLQEAIATLSTNNLIRRREAKTMATERTLPSRMSSLAHRALTESTLEDAVSFPEGLVREEHYHRGMAVQALNSALGDPQRRLSDSVLATLLVLCLFHISDTGVAQFKTQFSGVKKLLAIRMRNAGAVPDSLKWFIRLFTWLDTLTATTNNREAELGGTCLDIATTSDEGWGLENIVGCDSSLFKMVAQLGRLNLLSRNQAVKAPMPPEFYSATTALPASMLHAPLSSNCGASGPANIYQSPIPTPGASGQTGQAFSPAFWSEWFSLRQRLESWRIPSRNDQAAYSSSHPVGSQIVPHAYTSTRSSPSSQYLAAANLADIANISESFRYSAILYCERLAYPDLPCGHPRIQNIVQMAVRHISAVQSDVFLLWPLFITGSECVLKEHRDMIRSRCMDISKDSGFFNNISCLELLEKVWAQSPGTDEMNSASDSFGMLHGRALGDAMTAFGSKAPLDNMQPGSSERGFRWDRVMQLKRADGEYMVV